MLVLDQPKWHFISMFQVSYNWKISYSPNATPRFLSGYKPCLVILFAGKVTVSTKQLIRVTGATLPFRPTTAEILVSWWLCCNHLPFCAPCFLSSTVADRIVSRLWRRWAHLMSSSKPKLRTSTSSSSSSSFTYQLPLPQSALLETVSSSGFPDSALSWSLFQCVLQRILLIYLPTCCGTSTRLHPWTPSLPYFPLHLKPICKHKFNYLCLCWQLTANSLLPSCLLLFKLKSPSVSLTAPCRCLAIISNSTWLNQSS